MAAIMHSPETCYLEPEHYRNQFHNLYWSVSDHDKKPDKKSRRPRISKNELARKGRPLSHVFLSESPILLGNPSQFAVFAVVRSTILSRWTSIHSLSYEPSDDSETEENQSPSTHQTQHKLPKMVGVGLCTLYSLISDSRTTHPSLCARALKALFDTVQGHAPEELMQEPSNVMQSMYTMLMDVCNTPGSTPSIVNNGSHQTAAGASCLLALVVAYGQTEYLLGAVTALLMSPPSLADQYISLPSNIVSLQRSVQSLLIGTLGRNFWLSSGIPSHSLISSFTVNLPPEIASLQGDLIMRSITSDGSFIYIYTSKGLLKVGSGYGGTIKEHIYLYKSDFFPNEKNAWLGYCKNDLFLKMGRKRCEIYQIDKETLDIKCSLRLDPPSQWSVSTMFTDGTNLGVIALTNQDGLIVRLYNAENAVKMNGAPILPTSELSIRLSRRRTLVFGWAPFEEPEKRRVLEPLDSSFPPHGDSDETEHISCVVAGQEFSLLKTESGKVYYMGKATALGYKISTAHCGRWSQLTEAHLTRNETQNPRKIKIMQIAIGHDGTHAILVTDGGSAFFVGTARRGEDGDLSKHRRQPKPSRPKKIVKAEGHFIIYAACNYGSTALVTNQGTLLMFGKDAHHCDGTGIFTAMKGEHITQVALGKAHGVAINSKGQAFTFGINNKGQCGRDSSHSKEKHHHHHSNESTSKSHISEDKQKFEHSWKSDICMVCTLCNNCTGFSTDCQYSSMPDRNPGQVCGCGEGDSGCYICGVCRRCASSGRKCVNADTAQSIVSNSSGASEIPIKTEKSERLSPAIHLIKGRDSPKHRTSTPIQYSQGDESTGGSDAEREGSVKVSSLPPGKIHVPGNQKVTQVACGLHHTVILLESGDVYSFGSNQYGQLGTGDLMAHSNMVKMKVPKCTQIAAGSNHTAVLTNLGEVYSVGNYQKGTLGRQWEEETSEKGPLWYTSPGRVHRLGPSHACKAVWISASADQTFIHVNQALVKTDVLFTATVTANDNTIAILPNRPEHNFKCIMISKTDGNCYSYTGWEQADFVNSLACLDPLYDVFWCYHPKTKIMKCFNILAVESLNLHRCHPIDPAVENPAKIYAAELLRNRSIENVSSKSSEVSRSHEHDLTSRLDYQNENRRALSILSCDLAIPVVPGSYVTRFHAALHLLATLDVLTFANDSKFGVLDCKRDSSIPSKIPNKDDFLTVTRFESHGGGWGYSGHSIEAIRFMADSDVILGGLGLFGGRGDYTAKIKLFDIGNDGGDQEIDGELISETDEIVYECSPRDRYPLLFDNPVPITANRWYVAWACISGPSSDCGSSGLAMVINDDIAFHFKTSKKSNNGTDVNAGQIPSLLYNTFSHDSLISGRNNAIRDPVALLSKNFSRWITPGCFQSLITLLQWSWNTYKQCLSEVNSQSTLHQKNCSVKQLDMLVYICRATLRLIKSYVNEIYQHNGKKKQGMDLVNLNESINVIKSLLRLIMADAMPSPSTLARKFRKGKVRKPVNSYIEYTSSILRECHKTIVACFHAFFPTPSLKWEYLCSLLGNVKDGAMESGQARELTATAAALCAASRLQDVLHYTLPLSQNRPTKPPPVPEVKFPPLPVVHLPISGQLDSLEQTQTMRHIPSSNPKQPRPPIPPPRNHEGEAASSSSSIASSTVVEESDNTANWNLSNVLNRLLELVTAPVKRQMQTTGHMHAPDCPILPDYQLTKHCCKLLARMVAELAQSSTCTEDVETLASKSFMTTPSRFARINQSRSWNTGNGSPDALCFTVDKSGIILVGAVLYGGTGNYNYELEILQDVKGTDDSTPVHCWFSVDSIQGSFSAEDIRNDIVHVKFDQPIPLKDNVRYAIRLRNHGGRTANGDGGAPTVRGPDGTIFSYSTCSLSFNGTTQTRGQIPGLLYYSTPPSQFFAETGCEPGASESISATMRSTSIRVATSIIDSCVELLKQLRTDYTAEDLIRHNAVLQTAPCFTILIPFTVANLLLLNDARSSVQILEKLQTLTTHVAALNLLIPSQENIQSSMVSTTGNHYTWVESDHPYKPATVSNIRVVFPPSVSWIVLEMDPRSGTGQPDDSLTIFATSDPFECDTTNLVGTIQHNSRLPEHNSPLRKNLNLRRGMRTVLVGQQEKYPFTERHINYVPITPKMSNMSVDWPQKALVVPGNEVIFSLETATDYLNDFKGNWYGYRCLVVGHEEGTPSGKTPYSGLRRLEMELAYAAGACAARLLAPDAEALAIKNGQSNEDNNASLNEPEANDELDRSQPRSIFRNNEAMLISQGLEMAHPPTVYQVLQGQIHYW